MTTAAALRQPTGPGRDVRDASTRYLMYGLLPALIVPAAADRVLHRRVQDTALRESAIHLTMMAGVGLPAVTILLCEVDPAVPLLLTAGAGAHELPGLRNVRTAQDAHREVSVAEQHVHRLPGGGPAADGTVDPRLPAPRRAAGTARGHDGPPTVEAPANLAAAAAALPLPPRRQRRNRRARRPARRGAPPLPSCPPPRA
ncbi:hypothetical protein [Kitasatospora sp. NPDC058190]|uniref:hypothetical protein n=1 Tax=Kitasatospora sp. NPDC058190 TaxID=3346371 RepID=UPI0036DB3D4B